MDTYGKTGDEKNKCYCNSMNSRCVTLKVVTSVIDCRVGPKCKNLYSYFYYS